MDSFDQENTTASKVATITLAFWLMKICATTLGETAGDLLSMTWKVGYPIATLILLGGFFVSLALQLASTRFRAPLYWLVILTTSTAGTTMSDLMDRTLGLGYATGTAILSACLVAVLAVWYRIEGSLSVDRITRRRTEVFYWTAILVSNTLGTALGDFLADDSGLGFVGGAMLTGGLIALDALAYRTTQLSRVALFWIAFVLTRPFGATFGDLLTKMPEKGGLGFGTLGASAVLATLLLALLVWTMRARPPVAAVPPSIGER